ACVVKPDATAIDDGAAGVAVPPEPDRAAIDRGAARIAATIKISNSLIAGDFGTTSSAGIVKSEIVEESQGYGGAAAVDDDAGAVEEDVPGAGEGVVRRPGIKSPAA